MNIMTSVAETPLYPEGYFILVDKPMDWTSFDVVKKLRGALSKYHDIRKLKVGHAGTLDPLATGLLIIAVGKYTKKLQFIQDMTKHYEGTLKLGARTNTFDAEGEEQAVADPSHLSLEEIQVASKEFTGPIMQVPPIYSAIKINGQAAYSIARRGRHVEMKPRPVVVEQFDVSPAVPPKYDFSVICSKGTYIRSLANDLGDRLKVGGYLTRLVRTGIGEFNVTNAWQLPELVDQINGVIQSRG